MGTLVFIIALLLAIAFAFWRGRKSPAHRAINARPTLDDAVIRADRGLGQGLDPQTTHEVLKALGGALDLHPGKLRLDDELAALWDLDPQAGFHQRATFETWLLKRYPKFPPATEVETVRELIAALQKVPLGR